MSRVQAQCTVADVALPRDMFKHTSKLPRVAHAFVGGEELALGLWSPPYTLTLPLPTAREALTQGEHGVWVTRKTRLSAVHYHNFLSTSWTRTDEWKVEELDTAAVGQAVHEEVTARRDAWVTARDCGVEGGDGQTSYCHEVYLFWGAKMAIALGAEWDIRRRGADAYRTAHARGELPWQEVMKCMRRMLAE